MYTMQHGEQVGGGGQVRALDRTRPGLPREKGRAATILRVSGAMAQTTLFAALNVLDGKIIGQC